MCVKKSKKVILSVAATHRSLAWFRRLFLLTINALVKPAKVIINDPIPNHNIILRALLFLSILVFTSLIFYQKEKLIEQMLNISHLLPLTFVHFHFFHQ